MSAALLKGGKVAERLRKELHERALRVAEARGSSPHLAILSIGGAPSAELYLKKKLEACKAAGIECTVEALPAGVAEPEVLRILHRLGQDPLLDGIILDLPVPQHLDALRLTEAIAQDKDVEGVSSANLGKFYAEKSFARLKESEALLPCTAIAIVSLLLETGVEPRGKDALVIGRSTIVGRPTAHLLSTLDATVTLAHSRTRDLARHARAADILVSAAGQAGLVRGDWIKPGAIVLDAGVHRQGRGVRGDCDFESVKEVAGFLTPVPGGVGPLTVTFLLYNTVISAERRSQGL